MRLALLATFVSVIAGCASSTPPRFDCVPEVPECLYSAPFHLHNHWHEVLNNGTVVAAYTYVNSSPQELTEEIDRGASAWRVDPRTEVKYGAQATTWPADHASVPAMGTRETRGFVAPGAATSDAHAIAYYLFVNPFPGPVDAAFTSPCFVDETVIEGRNPDTGPCGPHYRLAGADGFMGAEGWVPLRPDAIEYKHLVWSCCSLRSLPDYDANESFAIPHLTPAPTLGNLTANRSFPVQPGATHGTVLAHLASPTPLANAPGFPTELTLTIVDDEGTEVGTATARAGDTTIEVPFDDVTSTGVWRAVATAENVPYTELRIEVHVRDALPDGEFPPQREK